MTLRLPLDVTTDSHTSDEHVGVCAIWERIAMAIVTGTALVSGCGPSVGEPVGDSNGGSAGDGATVTSEATATSSNDSASGGSIPDVPFIPPNPGMHRCFDFPPAEPACAIGLEPNQQLGVRCIPQEGQASCDTMSVRTGFNDAQGCLECEGFVESVPCGPVASGLDSCCFWVVYTQGQSCPGRPFTVDGESRLPRVAPRDDWAEHMEIDIEQLDPFTREVLSRGWAADGCFEHASVASFSRFVMELLAIGAPASLVADAQRALGQEVDHARAMFGLASAYGGTRIGPTDLDIRGALSSSHDPVDVAVALAREGCIAETISSLQLQVAAARAHDPVVRARLESIAEEELQHAALAWRALAWMMGRGDARLRERVASTFADAPRFVPCASDASDALSPEVLRAHGRLGAQERLALAQRALTRLVAPAAADLLAPWTVVASQLHARAMA